MVHCRPVANNPRPAGIMSVARSVFRTDLTPGSPNFLSSVVYVACIVHSVCSVYSCSVLVLDALTDRVLGNVQSEYRNTKWYSEHTVQAPTHTQFDIQRTVHRDIFL
jgi:hypothetical protein